MAAVLLLLLLLCLSAAVAAAASSAPADCGPPPALLLVSQVTELARTALTTEPWPQQPGLSLPQQSGTSLPQQSGHSLPQQPGLSLPQQPGLSLPQQPGTSLPQSSDGALPVSASPEHLLERLQALEVVVDQLNATVAGLSGGEAGPSGSAGGQSRPRSCLQLQQANGSLPDDVYRLAGLEQPVYCDFSHDGGGWTLLLTAATRDGWDLLNIRLRNAAAPSLTDNYSILGWGDALKALGTGERFAYRLEAQAQTGRRQWGGIWLAPRDYTLTPETDNQRDIALVRKFNSWTYGKTSLQKTMPWINVEEYLSGIPVLTNTLKASKDWWGTLVTDPGTTSYNHSPWINAGAVHSGTILYWMREEVLP